MESLDLIDKNAHVKINENSIMVFYTIDVMNIPPFMCSPFIEDWIHSESIEDLCKYLFELLIPTYLINTLFIEFDEIEDKYYSLKEAIFMHEKYNNDKDDEALKELISIYDDIFNRKISYLEFTKLLINLESLLEKLNIDFHTEFYVNPFEARYSKNVKNRDFNYQDLGDNF